MFIMKDNRRLSFEEKVARVEEVLKKYPNATRSKITQWTGYKGPVLDQMYEAGVKVPKKKITRSNNTTWMKQLGSLSGR
jgi:serine/threonine-protein kinase RIO1